MSREKLMLVFMPSLVATLLNREKAKGAALTELEVLQIRDTASVAALSVQAATEVEAKRGYKDIDADNVWTEWQRTRVELQ